MQRRAIWVTAREIIELRERHRREITEALGSNTYALPFLDYLYERPIVSVRTVQQRLDCAFATANKLTDQFVELGLLRETTGGRRNRRFRYDPYLVLFEASTRPPPKALSRRRSRPLRVAFDEQEPLLAVSGP